MMMSRLVPPSGVGMPMAMPALPNGCLPVAGGDVGDEGRGLVEGGAKVGGDDSGAQAVRDRKRMPLLQETSRRLLSARR